MTTRTKLSLRVLVVIALLAAISPSASAAPMPIATTGHDRDIVLAVAEGSTVPGDGTSGFGPIWYEVGSTSVLAVSHGIVGLPSSGSFVSTSGSGATFQLQSYSASNVLDVSDAAGALTLSAPGSFQTINVLISGVNAPIDGAITTSLPYTLNFADATTTAGTLSITGDWDTVGSPLAITPGLNSDGTGPTTGFMYDPQIALSAADQARTLNSITFTLTATPRWIFALSGERIVPPVVNSERPGPSSTNIKRNDSKATP